VASILREYAAEFVARHPSQAAPHVKNVLARLGLCRTRALGGRTFRCRDCRHECQVYNSCGDRHCPQCGGARRSDWLDRSAGLLLPSVNYFQIVFTLPAQLSALALGNRRPVYAALMRAAWKSLRETLRNEQGIDPAALLMLHTWNQRLEHHAHAHALVPGGGPTLDGSHWKPTRHPRHRRRQRPYLCNHEELGRLFRRHFLAQLNRLHRQGLLTLKKEWASYKESHAFAAYLDKIAPDGWVVFIEPPPIQNASPENVLKYLARYMTGGPISDRRLISHENGRVNFWARSTEKPPPGERAAQVPIELSGAEFTRRWALHILPKGFTKVRCYGGFSNTHRQNYLRKCRDLLNMGAADDDSANEKAQENDSPPETSSTPKCPHCGGVMTCTWATDRPGWSVVMHGQHRPRWYRDD
jgi:hypothetical protein